MSETTIASTIMQRIDSSLQENDLFVRFKCCVIIPTYNNITTLPAVIDGVMKFTSSVLVVDDGSTDGTSAFLKERKGLSFITYETNQGKGHALKAGFAWAIQNGYEHAITIDSDGQHYPEDLIVFLEKLAETPGALIIGARNLDQPGIPKKSSFGNRFSSLWVWLETTKKIPDTQSGFRLYPVKKMQKLRFYSKKYEFEIEALVRSSWAGIKILSVPVQVYYPEKEKRVSHFRPFRDSFRISILNTVLVLLALLIVLPFKFISNLNRKSIKEFINTQVLHSKDSNLKLTFSVMLGVFMSTTPIWGWQFIVALTIAYFIKLNKVIVATTANLSVPPLIPLILYFSYLTGGIVLGIDNKGLTLNSGINFEFIKTNIYQYIIGSLVFGAFLSLACGLVTFTLLRLFRRKR